MESNLSQGTHNTILTLSGKIDEKSKFPQWEETSNDELIVDFHGVTTINSLGIQRWLDFTNELPKHLSVSFVNSPPCVILQINMLENFLPPGGKIQSVLVPFYCNNCDREFTEKHVIGKDIELKNGQIVLNKNYSTLCQAPSCDVETDINKEKFFHFMRRQNS